ncbi:MAG: IS5 family transposase [Thioalkalivibrio sp.]|nr:IS5 family transposase [Thioalkalivibrio sp.]
MQLTFGDAEGLGQRKRTRREIFLAEMEQVVPWRALLTLIEPHYPKMGRPGRQPYALSTMLRIHFLQQWYALSDPAMEEALYEIPTLRRFAQLGGLDDVPDETTILNFRRLLEKYDLARKLFNRVNAHLARKGQSLRAGTIVDATIIAAPSSTKNQDGERDPEMHQTKKGNQWHFGMKAHIGVDDESGLVHHVECTAANAADITQVHKLLHGREDTICGDSGYTGAENREELQTQKARFLIAEKPSKLRRMKNKREYRQAVRWEKRKASLRAKVEHPFRVIKRQFCYTKTRYRGLAKNTAQVLTLFALSNLWMARRHLLPAAGLVRL